MRYKLFDFQRKAALSLAKEMSYLQKDWHDMRRNKLSSIALVAPTGAGKTVICSAIAEGLFYGLSFDNGSIKQDEDAVILWLSDSPPLNEQTKNRFFVASDGFRDGQDMVIIDPEFAKSFDKLERHKIYFLNRQKLSMKANLAKSSEGSRTFWDILRNTIEDSSLNLYVFIDEAHKGLGTGVNAGTKESLNFTIYEKLINGQKGLNPPMPVVIGISATIDRWDIYMNKCRNRSKEGNVIITNEEVRKAGIIKHSVELRSPETSSNVKDQDLFLSCRKLEEFTKHWKNYCTKYEKEMVKPLMVVQVENNISNESLFDLCNIIKKAIPTLDNKSAFANVFGEHEDFVIGEFYIPYISPDKVQEEAHVRVLFAKDAISTGWDCPRAEVLYSRRRRHDKTYIHQMLGRMVRTPLAQSIDSDEFLNSVVCYLPEYDKQSVDDIVELIKKDGDIGSVIKTGDTDIVSTQETKEFIQQFMNAPDESELEDISEETYEQQKMFSGDDAMTGLFSDNNNVDNVVEDGSSTKTTDTVDNVNIVDNTGIIKSNPAQGVLFTDDSPKVTRQHLALQYQRKHGTLPKGIRLTTKSTGKGRNDFLNATEKDVVVTVDEDEVKKVQNNMTTSTLEEDNDIREKFCSLVTRYVEPEDKNPFKRFFTVVDFLVRTKKPTGESWEDEDRLKDRFYEAIEYSIKLHKSEFNEMLHDIRFRKQYVVQVNPLTGEKNKVEVEDSVKIIQLRLFDIANNDMYNSCKNTFNSDYVNYYLERFVDSQHKDEEFACQRLYVVTRCEKVRKSLEEEITKFTKELVQKHDVNKGRLSDSELEEWNKIVGISGGYIENNLVFQASSSIMDTTKTSYKKHLFSSKTDGNAYFKFNAFEDFVVKKEIADEYNIAWYRNPANPKSRSSLSIPYFIGNGKYANFYPDFIFFERNNSNKVICNIVDPHSSHLSDSLARLNGYVKYLKDHGDDFAKVLVISDIDGKYKYLDLKNPEVVKAIENFEGTLATPLFAGPLGHVYGGD